MRTLSLDALGEVYDLSVDRRHVSHVLDSLQKDRNASFYTYHVVSEELDKDFDIVHVDEHHAPWKLVVLVVDKLVDLEHILRLLFVVKLQKVVVVCFNVVALLLLFIWVDREQVARRSGVTRVVALGKGSWDLPFLEGHNAVEDVLRQLQILLAVSPKVEFFSQAFDV